MKINSRQGLVQTSMLVMILALALEVQAQFTYQTNVDNTITITGYTGSGGAVTIPDTINGLRVASIEDDAFGDASVTSVTIGNSVTNIGHFAFLGCRELTAVIAGSNNAVYSSVGGVLFDKNRATLILCPEGLTGSYLIPNGVTSIGARAFFDTGLTSINIPNGVTSIGDEAFVTENGP